MARTLFIAAMMIDHLLDTIINIERSRLCVRVEGGEK